MQTTRTSLTALAATILLASVATADTITVNPGGSGDATTIQGGIDLAQPGWTVMVDPGTYVENVTMTSGVELVSSAGPEFTEINGTGDTCVACVGCGPGTLIEGFTITGGGGDVAGGIYVFDHSDVEIRDCIIRDNTVTSEAAGILVQRYSFADIHDNQLINNAGQLTGAISVIVNSSAEIADNLFQDNRATVHTSCIGINTADANIVGNVFIANTSNYSSTIHLAQPGTQASITSNTFLNNHSYQGASCVYVLVGAAASLDKNLFANNTGMPAIRLDDGYLLVTCNDFWNNGVNFLGIPDPVGQYGNIGLDPLLCDELDPLAALAFESPCLSSGCGPIGANPVPACEGPVAIEGKTWSSVKKLFE